MQKFFSRRIELGLLILAAVVFAITLVSLELSQDNALTTDLIYLIGGFIGVFTIAHLAMCFLAPYADQVMLPIVAILNGIGLIVLARLDLVNDRGLAPGDVDRRWLGALCAGPGGCQGPSLTHPLLLYLRRSRPRTVGAAIGVATT